VIHGYEDGGKTLLFYDYNRNGETVRLAPEKIVDPGLRVPGNHGDALSPRDALLAALKTAVANWERASEGTGERKYWYGASAFDRWADDLHKAGDLSEADRKKLFDANWWTLDSLNDARVAGLAYLKRDAKLLGPEGKAALDRAAALIDQEILVTGVTFARRDVFLGPWTQKTLADWTPEVRKSEMRILEKARRIEAQVHDAFREALKAEDTSASPSKQPGG
jgi:hypothetical protein